jgi:hypothetical protein
MFFGSQTVHKDGSFVLIRSDIIKAKCENALASIKAAREKYRQEAMDKARAEMMNGFWFKLFKKPVPTDEQVESYLCDGVMFSELFRIQIMYYKQEDVANRLLSASKYADEMYVSTEDLERL